MGKASRRKNRDRNRHIKQMREQLQVVSLSEICDGAKFKSLEDEEAFLKGLCFLEGVEERPLFEQLEREGISLPAPASMNDEELHEKLWEVVRAMAVLGSYLSSTDHLSDRELYERLWSEILREPASICPDNPECASYIDILGGCSEEDLQIRLRYYADEDERECWEGEFPDEEVPPHEELPYDRDRHLPCPKYGIGRFEDAG